MSLWGFMHANDMRWCTHIFYIIATWLCFYIPNHARLQSQLVGPSTSASMEGKPISGGQKIIPSLRERPRRKCLEKVDSYLRWCFRNPSGFFKDYGTVDIPLHLQGFQIHPQVVGLGISDPSTVDPQWLQGNKLRNHIPKQFEIQTFPFSRPVAGVLPPVLQFVPWRL